MKEFIEKLIGRLEKLLPFTTMSGDYIRKKDVIEIVNQLAEEYKHCIKSSCSNCEVYDTEKHYCPKWCDVIKNTVEELVEEYSVTENDQDLMIVGSLPSLYPMMQQFEVEAIDRVVSSAKHSGGWISVSDKLPDKDMWCLATFESGGIDKIQYLFLQKWWNGEMGDNRVIAWQPLPEPFKPIAE